MRHRGQGIERQEQLVRFRLGDVELSGGTVLIREWHGTKHQVTLLKDGFLYRTKRFHSLSQIAPTITGSRWSGPLFFGLKSSRKVQTNEAA